MSELTEYTGRQLNATLRRMCELMELTTPETFSFDDLKRILPKVSEATLQALAKEAVGYEPRRGVSACFDRSQVLAIKDAFRGRNV